MFHLKTSDCWVLGDFVVFFLLIAGEYFVGFLTTVAGAGDEAMLDLVLAL